MSYYSLHERTKEYWYYNLADEYVSVNLSGFEDRHNLNDPRLLCGDESGCSPPPETKSMSTTIDGESIYYSRVYIPPGTERTYRRIDKSNHAEIAAVSRYGQPPTGSYGGYTYNDFYNATNSDPMTGATLAQLKNHDCIQTDPGGILVINSQYPNVQEGDYEEVSDGWLHTRLYRFDGSVLQHDYLFRVNVNNYLNWYDRIVWDGNGNPIGYSGGGFIPQIIIF